MTNIITEIEKLYKFSDKEKENTRKRFLAEIDRVLSMADESLENGNLEECAIYVYNAKGIFYGVMYVADCDILTEQETNNYHDRVACLLRKIINGGKK